MRQKHYFTDDPVDLSSLRDIEVRLAGRDLQLKTVAGVFSGNRLDLGTRVLLRAVPDPPPDGDLLDLGCGWGPIAVTMGLLAPRARVWAVDVTRAARELTAMNATTAGATGVRAVGPRDVPADVRFAAIWSNPPIRIGKNRLHDLLGTWLRRLEPGGHAYLVVQRNLGADPLIRWIDEQDGLSAVKHSSAKGFRIIDAVRAHTA